MPEPDSCTAANAERYSIISSTRASGAGGAAIPSLFAVFMLITSSYLVGA